MAARRAVLAQRFPVSAGSVAAQRGVREVPTQVVQNLLSVPAGSPYETAVAQQFGSDAVAAIRARQAAEMGRAGSIRVNPYTPPNVPNNLGGNL